MPDNQIFKVFFFSLLLICVLLTNTLNRPPTAGYPCTKCTMCKGVAVMRRRSDSWLNATQILKVAGFDKPQRTRVLEREVQKGEHEKVQGGYGKYQGTWIPLERGLTLARQYNCEVALRPIIEFQPAAKSPPLAPKHLVSTASVTRPARRAPAPTPAVEPPPALISTRSRRHADVEDESEPEIITEPGSEDGSMTSSPSRGSSSSRTPSPIADAYDQIDASEDRRHTTRRKSVATSSRRPPR
ncbi:transcription regulator HTH, apses-type DNA-binding domain-containing protein [Chiua virens]|nr:transcription regulator HTH, apses-type DNA-binding domain-containing protein [Chiua virens]